MAAAGKKSATDTGNINVVNQSQPSYLIRNGYAQILVKPKLGIDISALNPITKGLNAYQASVFKKTGVIRINVKGNIEAALKRYTESGLVQYAEPNYLRKAAAVIPNDTFYNEQWGLKQIGMENAWANLGGVPKTVKVAILDTGVDIAHEDLKGVFATDPSQSNAILGKHFYTDKTGKQASDNDLSDNAGHGTHIAGIIAALTNNGLGVSGIAANARIMPVKVLDDVGYGDDANIAQGLIWAADNGARVVNMSLAGPTQSKTLADGVSYAVSKGVVVIAATGNEGSVIPNYPAAYDGVIGVGATDSKDFWMPESNYGDYVDIVAPGVSILSTYPESRSYGGTQYEAATGTSMAAGFVSGLAALILSKDSSLSGDQVKGLMMVKATDLGQTGWDKYFGYGRISADEALKFTTDNVKPTVSIVSPLKNARVTAASLDLSVNASDTGSGVAFIDLMVNGKRTVSLSTPPYRTSIWTKDFTGTSKIEAIAYDKNGNSSISEITCFKQTFVDVAPEFWAFQDIEALQKSKVLSGYPDGSFKPGSYVGRAEFVKMLIEGLGLPKKKTYSGYFKDVPKANWAWPYIEAAYDMGLVNGYTKTQFAPDEKIKRVEMAAILIKTGAFNIDYSGMTFKDVAASYWGFVYVMSAKNANIIGGYPGNEFRPENAMSRAESARVINKSFLE
jgi:subtilisin family serine protease